MKNKIFIVELIFLSLVFNEIPRNLQMNFLGGPVQSKLVFYPLFIGFIYTIYCQYKYKDVLVKPIILTPVLKEVKRIDNYQGNAVINFTDKETPYTRVIEHKHFEFQECPGTVITKEYPVTWEEGMEAYYPVNDERNNALFTKYQALAKQEEKVIFGGRLGHYKYYDMDKVIEAALSLVKEIKGE